MGGQPFSLEKGKSRDGRKGEVGEGTGEKEGGRENCDPDGKY